MAVRFTPLGTERDVVFFLRDVFVVVEEALEFTDCLFLREDADVFDWEAVFVPVAGLIGFGAVVGDSIDGDDCWF